MYDRKAADKRYRDKNRKAYNARIRQWKKDNPQAAKEQNLAYKKKNKIRLKEERTKYNKKHKEDAKAYNAQYYKEHKKDYKRRLNEWRKDNPERAKVQIHNRRSRKTKAGGSYTAEQWQLICKKYDQRCVCCNKRRKLVPDHVIPIAKGGTSDISNIQPLCQPCNSRKATQSTDYRH